MIGRRHKVLDRLLRFVDYDPETACWNWRTTISRDGYGLIQMRIPGADGRTRNTPRRAHRVMYEQVKGPIAADLVIDHLCRNTRCVNPLHLRAVSNRENILCGISPTAVNAAKERCIRGHRFHHLRSKAGKRYCRTCLNEHQRKARARVRALA